jgi:hypothetical protein
MTGFQTATAAHQAAGRDDQVGADFHDVWQTGADAFRATPAITPKLGD